MPAGYVSMDVYAYAISSKVSCAEVHTFNLSG